MECFSGCSGKEKLASLTDCGGEFAGDVGAGSKTRRDDIS